MKLTRSALARIAARSARSGSAPTRGATSRASFQHALHPLILRSELFVEGDVLELGHAVGQKRLAVLIEEELGVGKPRPDNALVAGDDRLAAVLRLQIRHHDEAVGELLSLSQREAFLMRLHRGREHLRRHRQKFLVEGADQRHGPFGQPDILLEQALDPRRARASPSWRGCARRRGSASRAPRRRG